MMRAVQGAFARAAAAAALAFLLGSCADSFAPLLLRTYDDPFQDVARAECFAAVNTIYLSWSADAGADEYILMRADDVRPYRFSQVYRGKGTAYADTFDAMTAATDRYLYRLDKVRGSRRFEGRRHAYGARTEGLLSDEHEDNDKRERSTLLEGDCIATLPSYLFSDGTVMSDEDWYHVSIGPRRTALIEVVEQGVSPNQLTHLRYTIDRTGLDAAIANSTAFAVENTAYEARTLRFRIYADMSRVLGTYASGSAPLAYRISLVRIQKE